MRSKTVDRLLKAMTKEVENFVDAYTKRLVNEQTKPMTTIRRYIIPKPNKKWHTEIIISDPDGNFQALQKKVRTKSGKILDMCLGKIHPDNITSLLAELQEHLVECKTVPTLKIDLPNVEVPLAPSSSCKAFNNYDIKHVGTCTAPPEPNPNEGWMPRSGSVDTQNVPNITRRLAQWFNNINHTWMELEIVLNPKSGAVGAIPADADTEDFLRARIGQKIRISKDDVKPQHPQYGKLFSSVKNYTQLVSEQRIQDLTKIWADGSASAKLVLPNILIATGHAEHTPITSPTDVTDKPMTTIRRYIIPKPNKKWHTEIIISDPDGNFQALQKKVRTKSGKILDMCLGKIHPDNITSLLAELQEHLVECKTVPTLKIDLPNVEVPLAPSSSCKAFNNYDIKHVGTCTAPPEPNPNEGWIPRNGSVDTQNVPNTIKRLAQWFNNTNYTWMELEIVLNPKSGAVGAIPADADTEAFLRARIGQKIRISKDDVKPQHPQYGKLFSSVKNYTQLVSEQRIQDLTKIWADGSVSDKLVLPNILIAIGHAEYTPIVSPTDVTDIIASVYFERTNFDDIRVKRQILAAIDYLLSKNELLTIEMIWSRHITPDTLDPRPTLSVDDVRIGIDGEVPTILLQDAAVGKRPMKFEHLLKLINEVTV
jgi:hypothetical protein